MDVPGHIDPLDPNTPPVDRSTWGPKRRAAFRSRSMEAFREGLMLRGLPDVRSSVIDDLSTYFNTDAEEVIYRATHAFELSTQEWNAASRNTPEDVRDFFLHVHTMCFGLLWHAYLQAEGYAPPVAVMIAEDMTEAPPASVLDFGCGPGAAGAMFSLLGYNATLADISVPLLKLTEFRLSRRNIPHTILDLNEQPPAPNTFQAVAAIQTFASVVDVEGVARNLHNCLRPGGALYADFDARPRKPGDSRLYDDDLPLRRTVQRVGFVQEHSVEHMTIRFRRVTPTGLAHRYRNVHDAVLLGPPRHVWRRLRYR
ncbi:MAG: class I SAM-dependent methyltransferase [Hyphomicrobiales bacterium]